MSKLLHINSRLMPYATWMLRILIGGTFILSGLSKMIDVWGFAYKIEQYFNVWGWQSTLQTNVIIGITISAIEFVVGLVLQALSYMDCSEYHGSNASIERIYNDCQSR